MPSVGLLPALAVIAGSLCGLHSQFPWRALVWVLPLVWVVAAVAWRRRYEWLIFATVAAGFWIGAAILAADVRETALHPSLRAVLNAEYGGFSIETLGPAGPHGPVRTRAVLTEDAVPQADAVTIRAVVTALLIRGQWHSVDGGVTLSVGGETLARRAAAWRAGRTIEAPVVFRRPTQYLNDGVADFERDLALDGTTLFGSIKSGLLVDVRARGNAAQETAADARAYVRRVVARWIASRDAVSAAIVSAVLIGDRTGIPDDVRDRLRAAGTYHVIAISGGNIAILVGLIVGALMLVGIRGRPAAIVSIVMLLVYAQVVTAGPSVWRATLMALLHLGARAVDHRTPTWHATAVAAAVMLLARPLDLQDPGFLLTFGATAALLKAAESGRELLPRNRALSWLAVSLVASVAVEITLVPIAARTFLRVTSAGVVLNLVAVPLMGLVQASGIGAVVLDGVGLNPSLAGWAAHAAASALIESARLVEVAPWLVRRVASPALVTVVAYYAALLTVVTGRGRIRLLGGTTLVAALAIVGGVSPGRWWGASSRHELRLTMFDVGQGESMLLEPLEAGVVMIDAAGAPFGSGGFDVGGRVLTPALWARGVTSLDALLITHADPDHLGGARAVIDAFAPKQLWFGISVPRHRPSLELLERAERAGLSVRARRAGERVQMGPVRIRVLHPPTPDWERQRVRNDDSVVLEVVYGDVALLLTGDISADVERAILPYLTPARVRVLKVAHHGSRSSSSAELLEGWRPQIALISCGRGNTFGHPAREVLGRLESIGATVLRTDRHGEITIETDGHGVRVRTFRAP